MTPRSRKPLAALAFALPLVALAGSLPAAARAADRDAVSFARATALARAGRCGDALVALSELRAPSAAAAHLRGQCQLEARDYPAALVSLEEAKRLDPKARGVELHLAVARFHMGDYAGAREALDAAEPAAPNDPQLHLYRGLLLLQEARSEEAARELAYARSLGSRVEPGASYYEGLAWVGADEREQANAAFDRVIRSAPPGSPWAQEAQRAKADLSGLGRGRGRAWGFARAGFEYDDNVVLRGDDVFPTAGGQHDVRGVWELYGGRQLVGGRGWAAGVEGTYYGSSHFDLSEFNQHYPVVGLWLDRRLAEATTARVSYDAGYAWIAYDPFLFTQELRPSLYHDFGRAGRSELFASFYKYDYLYSVPTTPPGPVPTDEAEARNRDGWGLAAGVEHTLALGVWDTELTGGLSYLRYSARGTEYSFQGVGTWLGSETPLPWDSVLRAQVGYAYLPFRHASTYPETVTPAFTYQNADRSDDRWRYELELEKYLTETLSVSARWSWLDNSSNVGVFDYDREITGVYLTYRLGR